MLEPCSMDFLGHQLSIVTRVLALMKNINDNALALMFKMVNEQCNIINNAKNVNALIINNAIFLKT